MLNISMWVTKQSIIFKIWLKIVEYTEHDKIYRNSKRTISSQ